LDLQKAFDTVDHRVLLDKLYCYGIRGIVYDWFQDYLLCKKQYVHISGVNSDIGNVPCGYHKVVYLVHCYFCYTLMTLATVVLVSPSDYLLMTLIHLCMGNQ